MKRAQGDADLVSKKRYVTCFEKGFLVLEKNALINDCF